jgi:uncharacterized protein
MEYSRLAPLSKIKRSFFLFGPRMTGKSFLLHKLFPNSPYYDLLRSETFLNLSMRPQMIREEMEEMLNHQAITTPVIIDEIQKLPLLLDEVHSMIEELNLQFILTGSSARKLKRGGTNLLGGRAWTRKLHPLCSAEIGDFDLQRIVQFGSLPVVYDSDYPEEDLKAYCGTYLQQEIAEEGAARKIDAFSRFLKTAALYNGEQVNYETWASDSAVPARTIREYFSVLEDTLIGEMLSPWKSGRKRKSVSAGKFYFFDLGVRNTLASVRQVDPGTDTWGRAIEHFIYTELRSYLDYSNDPRELSFWRTRDNREVDFILGDDTAIEVKATKNPSERHVKNLLEIEKEGQFKHLLLVCSVKTPRKLGQVEIVPLKLFLQRLWEGAYSASP